jgi:hypothetical protein
MLLLSLLLAVSFLFYISVSSCDGLFSLLSSVCVNPEVGGVMFLHVPYYMT